MCCIWLHPAYIEENKTNIVWKSNLMLTSEDERKWFQTNTLRKNNQHSKIYILSRDSQIPPLNHTHLHTLKHKLWTLLEHWGHFNVSVSFLWGSVNSWGHYRAAATSQQLCDKERSRPLGEDVLLSTIYDVLNTSAGLCCEWYRTNEEFSHAITVFFALNRSGKLTWLPFFSVWMVTWKCLTLLHFSGVHFEYRMTFLCVHIF